MMKKSRIYLTIGVITYLLLMIVNKFVTIPDLLYLMFMAFSIVLVITAIKEQNKEEKCKNRK